MDPAIGTTAQVAAALAIPARTIRRYAANGWIRRHGTGWPPRYDARQVAQVRARLEQATRRQQRPDEALDRQ